MRGRELGERRTEGKKKRRKGKTESDKKEKDRREGEIDD